MTTFGQLKSMGLLAGLVGGVAQTPSGGLHVYFPGTEERSSTLTGRHVDFKAAGGYVIAAPSTFVSADYSWAYQWLLPLEEGGAPLDWPEVARIYQPRRGPGQPRSSEVSPVWPASCRACLRGERNQGLFLGRLQGGRAGRHRSDRAARGRGGRRPGTGLRGCHVALSCWAVAPVTGREEFEIDPAEAAQAKEEVLSDLAPRLLLTRADEVQARRVKYLWEGRIPNGAMTVMPGEEGWERPPSAYG